MPASIEDSRQGTTTRTEAQEVDESLRVDSGESEGGTLSNANDDLEADTTRGDEGVLETGGDAGAVAGGAGDGGQAHGRKKRPPRVGSVRQGRKEKRKAEWQAKKARMKETKLLERQQR